MPVRFHSPAFWHKTLQANQQIAVAYSEKAPLFSKQEMCEQSLCACNIQKLFGTVCVDSVPNKQILQSETLQSVDNQNETRDQ